MTTPAGRASPNVKEAACPAARYVRMQVRTLPALLVLGLIVTASACGHKSETSSATTSTAAGATPAAVATLSGASSSSGMNGTTTGGGTTNGNGQPQGFDTESAAQSHCANDEIVWLNTHTRVYHQKSGVYYGKTKSREYVCRKDADAAGDHLSRNGT